MKQKNVGLNNLNIPIFLFSFNIPVFAKKSRVTRVLVVLVAPSVMLLLSFS